MPNMIQFPQEAFMLLGLLVIGAGILFCALNVFHFINQLVDKLRCNSVKSMLLVKEAKREVVLSLSFTFLLGLLLGILSCQLF